MLPKLINLNETVLVTKEAMTAIYKCYVIQP